MISYLDGQIVLKEEKFIVLNVGGIGYKVFLSQKALNKITRGSKNLKVFCYLNITRNAMDLYGFLSFEELKFFNFLNDIPSIGPKAALEVAAIGSVEKVKTAIDQEDDKIIKQIYSIGKKKAQRIILEISRQIKKTHTTKTVAKDEAFEALFNLGYSQAQIKKVLAKIPAEKSVEEKIKEALKILSK